mmetsp:Transcript_11379/g.24272  ORF Transcript_11379/g.24272 Transcript_11379/m.24272 type:complete len:450 (-) Transcript_11379:269-1618(-)
MSSHQPAQWPKEVSDNYTADRVVGKGGFASVWMATKKQPTGRDDHVAVKIMQDDGYAKREIEILSELTEKYTHPNIVRLLEYFKAEDGANFTILSLARGPTLNFILTTRGALGLVIAQSISQQLINAIAFLHGHAVIHRDIQPANIIVSGSQINDDLWWSDDRDVDGKVLKMAKQCHITLVDFGFARALSPTDIKTDVGLKKVDKESVHRAPEMEQATPTIVEVNKFGNTSCINQALNDPSRNNGTESRGRGRTRELDIDNSISHAKVRDLSALGTRNYAAPEITSGIRNLVKSLNGSNHKTSAKTLGACVSNYGMDADAFSVGATIRHMVTGVAPGIDVEDFIASKNQPIKKLARALKSRVKKGSNPKRIKKYRLGEDLPGEVCDLVEILTFYNSRKRATVRSVTDHSWIKLSASASSNGNGKLEGKAAANPIKSLGPVVYLQCAEEK